MKLNFLGLDYAESDYTILISIQECQTHLNFPIVRSVLTILIPSHSILLVCVYMLRNSIFVIQTSLMNFNHILNHVS